MVLNKAHHIWRIDDPPCKKMLGGTRNGRAVKLALLVGAVLLFLYFLISWRVEAQNLSNDLAIAEEEYARIVKKLHHLENELKGV